MRVASNDGGDAGRFVFEPDGSLVSEFVLMEQIYSHSRTSRSHDAFWCHLGAAEGGAVLPSLPHDARF